MKLIAVFSLSLLVAACSTNPRGGPATYPDHGAATTQGVGARVQMGGSPHVDATALPGSEATTAPMTDREFFRQAAQMGIAEIKMGEMAMLKATDSSLRDFGKHLISDHSLVNEELAMLASRKGYDVATEVDSRQASILEKLRNAEGNSFDNLFEQAVIQTHQRAVQLFRTAAQTSADNEVRAFALNQLPALEQHLAHAKRLTAGSAFGGSVGPDF